MLLRLSFVILCTVLFNNIHGQKLNHVLGEVLVELPQGVNSQTLQRKLSAKMNIPVEIRYNQLISEPMNVWSIKVNPNTTNESTLLRSLQHIDIVLNAQYNHITQNRNTPNDPSFGQQWQYINDGSGGGSEGADIDMDLAWDITTGGLTADGDTIVVCIVDDGINLTHPDIQDNLWVNHSEIPNNGIDDDNNGFVDDYRGWNAYNATDVVDGNGSHGTPVAGILAAKGNNMVGVAGINWDVKAMIVVGGSPESTALISYGYAYSQRKRYNETNGAEGAFVVATNSSWGIDRGQPEDAPIWCDFYNVMGAEGIISCGATANRNFDIDVEGDLPTACSSDYLISVTNLGRNDSKVNQAGYGVRTVDLGAYGEDTYTLTRNNYGGFGGTSGATPHVAGVVALAYATDCQNFIDKVKTEPGLTALAVKDMILFGNVPNESLDGRSVTNGRLNANNTILNMISLCEDSCSEAYGVTVNETDVFSAKIGYSKYDNQGNVSLRYRLIGSEDWIEINDALVPFILSDLDACADYEYQTATTCNDSLGQFSYTKIFRTEGCCEEPTLGQIAVEGDIASVTWSNVIGANQYTIEYKEESQTEWNSINVDENTQEVSIPNIEMCKLYDIRVKATCEISGKESEYIYSNFSGPCGDCTADYCEITPKDTRDEWLESVKIEGVFENISGNNNGAGSYIGAFDIKLNLGQSYEMTLTQAYTGMSYPEFFSVYIDLDHSGDFSEEELILANEEGLMEPFVSSFILPTDAVLGITRMRVIMRYDTPNNSSCDDGSWEFGEYEDYCVDLIEADLSCPESLSIISDIDSTENTLAFSLTSSISLASYNINYRVTGETEINSLTFESNLIKLENLEKCSTYEIIYSGNCDDGNQTMESSITLKTRCSTSIEEQFSSKIAVYPSPSTGFLNIETPTEFNIQKVTILNPEGKTVYSSNQSNLDLTTILTSGIYFIKIDGKENSVVKMWVKY